MDIPQPSEGNTGASTGTLIGNNEGVKFTTPTGTLHTQSSKYLDVELDQGLSRTLLPYTIFSSRLHEMVTQFTTLPKKLQSLPRYRLS